MSVNGNSETSSRPKHSKFKQKFKQQRLPAWQPILTADTVLPAFFLIGLLFVPLGVALLLFSTGVVELQQDYTDCTSTSISHRNAVGDYRPCKEVIEDETFLPGKDTCVCKIPLKIDKELEKNVYMYYGLDNFYQNHRRYVKSREDKQMQGKAPDAKNDDCAPYDNNGDDLPYAPRGAIANSLFNDSIILKYVDSLTGENEVGLIKTGIAWESDKKTKFRNPEGEMNDGPNGAFKDTVKPEYWSKPVWQLDTENPDNNGYQNEDLIVWMRTAAFPSFRKLYRKINHTEEAFLNSVPAGDYVLEIEYNYPVDSFGGRKRVILSTTSFLGGKNNFLGIAYITVGCICFLLGVVFLVIHVKFGERTTNHLNISPNTPYTE